MLSYSIYVVCSLYVTFLLPPERAPKVLAPSLFLLRSFFYDNNLTKISSKAKELVSYGSDIFKFYMFQNVGYSKLFETPISNIDLYEVL